MAASLAQAPAIAALVKDPSSGCIQTQPFLNLCRQIIPVVEQLGTAFTIVKNDINGNIERLATRMKADPQRFADLFSIIRHEVSKEEHGHNASCAKGLLWLKRAMQFVVGLIQLLLEDGSIELHEAASQTYKQVLQPFHGFLSSSAFTVAMKFTPSRDQFMQSFGRGDAEVRQSLGAFVQAMRPFLDEIHAWLEEEGLNDPTKV